MQEVYVMELVGIIIEIGKFVKFAGGGVVRYLKYQIQFNDYLEEFKAAKEDLCRRKLDIESRLEPELQCGKVPREEVQKWLNDVDQEITRQDLEDEVRKWGCLSCCCRVKILEERTQEVKEIYARGDKYTGDCLVIEDQAIIFNDCVKNFGELKEMLRGKHQDISLTLRSQLCYGKIEKEIVKNWLGKVEEITGPVAKDIEDEVQGGCLSHASLAKPLKERIQEMERFYEEGGQLPESLVVHDPSASTVELPISEMQSGDDIKAKILASLLGDEVRKLGVWGMGGVGKTTIMMHVYNELLREVKFKKVIWVTVSQTFEVCQLQEQIASCLEERLTEHQSTIIRAGTLSKMLERHRPFVLILDNVWRGFELKDVGIPEPLVTNGCKLVLTTRSKEVTRILECEPIEVKTLSPEASLKLFLDKVGDDVLLHDGGIKETLKSTLNCIVDECDGLPLAIVTVAGSMKGISDPRLWRVALNQLKEHTRNVLGTEDDEFKALKFSYDCLKDQIKYCFLYCAMYPEDYKIPKEEIIECWIEEGLIDVMETRQVMKDEGHAILRKLEDNCLLEFVKNGKDCVRMHDVVRDMALHITRTSPRFFVKAGLELKELPEVQEWREDILKVSLMQNYIQEIPSSMPSPKCPMLTTLLLSHNSFLTIPEAFFEHMLGLKILDLSNNEKLNSLPNSISKLVNLTTLLLWGCMCLKKVPSLSNLSALKKLDLRGTKIEEFPQGLEMLTNLKYLNLKPSILFTRVDEEVIEEVNLGLLSEIPDGMLSNLSKLQHLEVSGKIPLKGEEMGRLNLESINVRECPQLEEIIASESEEEKEREHCEKMEEIKLSTSKEAMEITVPKLKFLRLVSLPGLKRICSSTIMLICDSLERLVIIDCQKLRRIPLYLPLLDNGQPSSSSLKKIRVHPKEWWESLEWDNPNAKEVLSPLCHYSVR
ncbi:hypothetical protein SLEP1_g26648 [Rubroshorea leprosula]|uniref:NB-ARC domain-containing protein n=1 Tax=Rubroshorea leprosula TaxID=152421 RepID=A0AAV5JWD3_9ROSI|nr:hypothetical protein SLEP1_g26648 [Rubroshorea leprosula]